MRITNKIMQNNSLSNININKILQDKLNTQMITENKLVRPSDDPVVAIRALRLRGTLSELTQYYEKNTADAESWLKITGAALDTTEKIIEDMYEQCNTGASDSQSTESRQALLDSLKNLRDEIYSSGDSDFAGRGVFTGYRTSTKLTFQNDTSQTYRITEQLSRENLEKIQYIDTNKLSSVNEHNYNDAGFQITEDQVTDREMTRIRLGYDNLEGDYIPQFTDNAGNPISFTDSSGNPADIVVTPMSLNGADNPYQALGDDNVIFVPETGELLIGKNVNDKLQSMVDDPLTQGVDEGGLRITYEKTDWEKGDLNPVHYYACSEMAKTVTPGTPPVTNWTEGLQYNGGWETGQFEEQIIEYDVGFNQKLRINTTANECFNHDIGRDVDELIDITQQVQDMEAVKTRLEKVVEADPEDEDAKKRLAAVTKACDKLGDKMQNMFSAAQTSFKQYQANINQANTNCGTRWSRLELIQDRLSSQLTTFDELASNNEKVDTTKVAIELSSAELSYEAALLATGKVIQTSLLNFL